MPRAKASPPPTAACKLSPIEAHAVMIAGKVAAELRDQLPAGNERPVDLTIRLTGNVNVGEGQTQSITKKPPAGDVLALVLNGLSDMDRKAATRRVVKLYQPFTQGGDPPDMSGSTTLLAEQLLCDCAHKTTRDVRGNVTGDIAIEVIKRGKSRAAA